MFPLIGNVTAVLSLTQARQLSHLSSCLGRLIDASSDAGAHEPTICSARDAAVVD